MTNPTIDSFRPEAGARLPMPPRRPWLRVGIPLLVIGATAGVLLDAGWHAWRPRTDVVAMAVAVRSIETTEVARRDEGTALVQAPGWVEPAPYEVFAAALTPGVIDEILVLEGGIVTKGQPVATLVRDDARIDLDRARAELSRRRAALTSAEAKVAAAKIDLRELVAPRRRVAVANAEQARLAADLAAYPARIATLEATRDEVRDEHERKQRLVADGAVAAGPVERLGIRLRALDAQLDALRIERDAAAAKLDAATAESTAAARDLELLVRERLAVETASAERDAATADLAMAMAAVEAAELRLSRCTVVSPIDGVVVERLTSPGSPVGTGPDRHAAHVLHVYDPASLQIRADIPLADAARVGVGQTADIVVDLLPDTVFRGTVTRFVHRADLAKNTVEAKIRIDDPSPLLKPDMLARVRLHAESDPQTGAARTVTRVFAPEAAVRNGVAWVVEGRRGDAGTAHQRTIELGGARIDGWVEVIAGLHPGDLIVLEGAVAEGLPVRVRTQDTTIDGRADA